MRKEGIKEEEKEERREAPLVSYAGRSFEDCLNPSMFGLNHI